MYRLLVALDGISGSSTLYMKGTEYFQPKIFIEILSYFLQKYPSKIIWALSELKISSFHEIRKLTNLENMTFIRKLIFRMEQLGLVKEVSKEDEDFRTIFSFWCDEYPNTHRKRKIMLFKLIPEFYEVVELYADWIVKSYITRREFKTITDRGRRYIQHRKVVDKQLKSLKEHEIVMIGRCQKCKAIIRKGSIRGTDYHKYPIGIICNSCQKKFPKSEIIKWMR